MRRLILHSLFILCLVSIPIGGTAALDWLEIDVGQLLLVNTDEDSAPSPILSTFGAAIPIHLVSDPLYWETSLLITWLDYQHSSAEDGSDLYRPAEVETANTLFTLMLILDTRFGYRFTLSEKVQLGGAAGLAAVFRLPIVAIEQGGQYQSAAWSYFLLRSVYPEVEVACIWRLFEPLALTFTIRTLFPIFHLWDGEGVSFFDQTIFMGNLGFRIFFQ